MKILYVSGVTQFILFDKLFVEYCSFSAMFLIWLIIAPQLITPCMTIGGGLWFRVGLEFPSVAFRFVSFVNISKRLCVSILFSGVSFCIG